MADAFTFETLNVIRAILDRGSLAKVKAELNNSLGENLAPKVAINVTSKGIREVISDFQKITQAILGLQTSKSTDVPALKSANSSLLVIKETLSAINKIAKSNGATSLFPGRGELKGVIQDLSVLQAQASKLANLTKSKINFSPEISQQKSADKAVSTENKRAEAEKAKLRADLQKSRLAAARGLQSESLKRGEALPIKEALKRTKRYGELPEDVSDTVNQNRAKQIRDGIAASQQRKQDQALAREREKAANAIQKQQAGFGNSVPIELARSNVQDFGSTPDQIRNNTNSNSILQKENQKQRRRALAEEETSRRQIAAAKEKAANQLVADSAKKGEYVTKETARSLVRSRGTNTVDDIQNNDTRARIANNETRNKAKELERGKNAEVVQIIKDRRAMGQNTTVAEARRISDSRNRSYGPPMTGEVYKDRINESKTDTVRAKLTRTADTAEARRQRDIRITNQLLEREIDLVLRLSSEIARTSRGTLVPLTRNQARTQVTETAGRGAVGDVGAAQDQLQSRRRDLQSYRDSLREIRGGGRAQPVTSPPGGGPPIPPRPPLPPGGGPILPPGGRPPVGGPPLPPGGGPPIPPLPPLPPGGGGGGGLRTSTENVADFGNAFERMGARVALSTERLLSYALSAGGLYTALSFVKSSTKEFFELETQITKVQQLLNKSGVKTTGFYSEVRDFSVDTGTQLGVKPSDIASNFSTLAQAGYRDVPGLKTASKLIAESQLTPSFGSQQEVVDGLIATYKQFGLTLNDTGFILDNVNKFSKDYAVESKDLFEIIKRGGSAFATLGGNFQDFLKLGSALRAQTRESAASLGTFLKTASVKLYAPKFENYLSKQGAEGKAIIQQQDPYEKLKLMAALIAKMKTSGEKVDFISQFIDVRQSGRALALLEALNAQTKELDETAKKASGSIQADVYTKLNTVGKQIEIAKVSMENVVTTLMETSVFKNTAKGLSGVASGVSGLLSNKEVAGVAAPVILGGIIAALTVALRTTITTYIANLQATRGLTAAITQLNATTIQNTQMRMAGNAVGGAGLVGGAVAGGGASRTRQIYTNIRNSPIFAPSSPQNGLGAASTLGLMAAPIIGNSIKQILGETPEAPTKTSYGIDAATTGIQTAAFAKLLLPRLNIYGAGAAALVGIAASIKSSYDQEETVRNATKKQDAETRADRARRETGKVLTDPFDDEAKDYRVNKPGFRADVGTELLDVFSRGLLDNSVKGSPYRDKDGKITADTKPRILLQELLGQKTGDQYNDIAKRNFDDQGKPATPEQIKERGLALQEQGEQFRSKATTLYQKTYNEEINKDSKPDQAIKQAKDSVATFINKVSPGGTPASKEAILNSEPLQAFFKEIGISGQNFTRLGDILEYTGIQFVSLGKSLESQKEVAQNRASLRESYSDKTLKASELSQITDLSNFYAPQAKEIKSVMDLGAGDQAAYGLLERQKQQQQGIIDRYSNLKPIEKQSFLNTLKDFGATKEKTAGDDGVEIDTRENLSASFKREFLGKGPEKEVLGEGVVNNISGQLMKPGGLAAIKELRDIIENAKPMEIVRESQLAILDAAKQKSKEYNKSLKDQLDYSSLIITNNIKLLKLQQETGALKAGMDKESISLQEGLGFINKDQANKELKTSYDQQIYNNTDNLNKLLTNSKITELSAQDAQNPQKISEAVNAAIQKLATAETLQSNGSIINGKGEDKEGKAFIKDGGGDLTAIIANANTIKLAAASMFETIKENAVTAKDFLLSQLTQIQQRVQDKDKFTQGNIGLFYGDDKQVKLDNALKTKTSIGQLSGINLTKTTNGEFSQQSIAQAQSLTFGKTESEIQNIISTLSAAGSSGKTTAGASTAELVELITAAFKPKVEAATGIVTNTSKDKTDAASLMKEISVQNALLLSVSKEQSVILQSSAKLITDSATLLATAISNLPDTYTIKIEGVSDINVNLSTASKDMESLITTIKEKIVQSLRQAFGDQGMPFPR